MKLSITLLLSLVFITLFGQEINRNRNWVVGYSPTLVFNFKNDVNIDTLLKGGPSLSFGASCISNLQGNLQFFCNGFYVYDNDGWPIDYPDGNWDSINCPLGTKLRSYYGGDGFWNQASIILPKKNNSYYIFTTGMSDWAFDAWKKPDPPFDFRFDVLSYHIVDMDANNGKGKVVERNKILMQEARLSHNRMSAVRHANGRDWWLIKPHQAKQIFYTFLVKPDTIEGPFEQYGNLKMDTTEYQFGIYGIRGQSCFSPDGKYFASAEAGYKGVQLYKFDRCSGTINDYHFFKQVSFDTTVYDYSESVSFSPDSKLLYLISGSNIFQYEIKDTTQTSGIHIFGMDTLKEYFSRYSMSAIGPDNKLYIGSFNGTRGMSYIDKPNVRGLNCDFKPRGLKQNYTYLLVPPNMPNYGLSKIPNSPCDTIGKLLVQEMVIYPNPARDAVIVYLPLPPNTIVEIELYNFLGQKVQSWKINLNSKQEINLQLPRLAIGLYTLKATTSEKEFKGKLLIE